MAIALTATFYESWIRTIGSLPMRLMSVAILELNALGEHELAKDLMAIRERWAKSVSQRAKEAVEADRLQRVGAALESVLLEARARNVGATPRKVLDAG